MTRGPIRQFSGGGSDGIKRQKQPPERDLLSNPVTIPVGKRAYRCLIAGCIGLALTAGFLGVAVWEKTNELRAHQQSYRTQELELKETVHRLAEQEARWQELAEKAESLQSQLQTMDAASLEVRRLLGLRSPTRQAAPEVNRHSSLEGRRPQVLASRGVLPQGGPDTVSGQEPESAAQAETLITQLTTQLPVFRDALATMRSAAAVQGHRIQRTPYAWPVKAPISSTYGWRVHPITRRGQRHAGVDLAASHGTPVYSSAYGYVVYAGWKGGYGNAVIVDHGYGYQTMYAHLSRITARVGQAVTRSTILGAVGSTGISTGPHLHYEVRKNNEPINPVPYLP